MKSYTTFTQDDGSVIDARIGPLFVLNSDTRLNYECPPNGYNGFDVATSFCQMENDATMMAVAFVSMGEGTNETLWRFYVILSGSPFPAELVENEPPFGAALYKFENDFLTMQSTGSLSICDTAAPVEEASCDGVVEDQTVHLQGVRYSGSGVFSVLGVNYTGPSVWIHDDDRQLLYLTAGEANGFWFNESGFLLADYGSGSCVWSPICNYACEVYNYNSRFLDFIGIWTITAKVGYAEFEPKEVKVFLGNAIDAAGIFPCLMYVSTEEGYYLGLDKLDTKPGALGSSFWYADTVDGAPDYSQYPIPTDMGCPITQEEWLGGGNAGETVDDGAGGEDATNSTSEESESGASTEAGGEGTASSANSFGLAELAALMANVIILVLYV